MSESFPPELPREPAREDRLEPAPRSGIRRDLPCPTCGAAGREECATTSGRDHRSRVRLMLGLDERSPGV